jgi:lipopolysaccharide export system protein LptC
MIISRRKLAALLVITAGASYWILQLVTDEQETILRELAHYPDYYMHNFTTLNMSVDGKPKNHLVATYMAHYPDDDTTELVQPAMTFFQTDKPPINVSSDKGWVTSDNEVILLSGNVYLYQKDDIGNKALEVIAEDARVLVEKDYAETDNAATVVRGRTVINSVGMRAYMDEQRMEFLSDVHTIIEPKNEP